MRRHLALALFLLPLACGGDKQAREVLEKDGFTDIELTAEGDGYQFTAKKGAQSCTGTINVSKGVGTSSHSFSSSCR